LMGTGSEEGEGLYRHGRLSMFDVDESRLLGADVQVQSHMTHSCHAPIFAYCTRDLSILTPRTHLSAEFDKMPCTTHMIFKTWPASGSPQPLGYRFYHSTVTHSYPTCMRAVWGQSNIEFSARHRILAKCHDGDTCRVGLSSNFPHHPSVA